MFTLALALALFAPVPDQLLAQGAPNAFLVVIVHRQNPVQRLSHDQLEALFTRTITRWDDGEPAVPLNAAPNTAARTTFDRAVLGLETDQVGRFWLDHRIRGLGLPPKQVPDPNMAQRVVENLRGAVAYVPSNAASSARVKIVARISQGKVESP
jgi:hypothetical protein